MAYAPTPETRAAVEHYMQMPLDELSAQPSRLLEIILWALYHKNLSYPIGYMSAEMAAQELCRLATAAQRLIMPEAMQKHLSGIKNEVNWPKTYKPSSDTMEFITQADVDMMETVCQAYGKMSEFFKSNHKALGDKLGWPEGSK